MNYMENTYVCLAAPLLLAVLCLRREGRRSLLFTLSGMTACLCSAYISTYLAALKGIDAAAASYEIVPVVEEIMKSLPVLFFLLVYEPEKRTAIAGALMVAVGFATFENVCFAYDDHEVLRGVSFTAKEGEVTALVGPSGSGKSTCARLAARLWDVSGGTIKVGGVDISTVDPEVLLTDYSMVFQDVVLFDDTVMENIRLGKHGATDEEVLAAAKAANCDEFVSRLPEGYATPIGENGVKLSGGERQRISIARALLKNAPIVLLDEATASLDVENETKVQGALSRLLAGKTVLVIAHRMRTVEAADKIVVLKDGKVAEEGSPKELYEHENGIFRRMTDLQSANAAWSV